MRGYAASVGSAAIALHAGSGFVRMLVARGTRSGLTGMSGVLQMRVVMSARADRFYQRYAAAWILYNCAYWPAAAIN